MLTGIDYVIVVVYLIGIMLLGVYFKRFVHSSKDFFLAGKGDKTFILPLTLSFRAGHTRK